MLDDLYVKCEFLHPGRSHKARVARALIDDAEARHGIAPGDGRVLLERTGGNLGVALAMEAKSRGYQLTLVTDSHYSRAKRELAARLGATVIDRGMAFPQARNNGEAVDLLLASGGSHFHYLDQFRNPANPRAHEAETGPEILADLVAQGCRRDASVILVTGLGTGASMKGISAVLRGWFARVVTVAVQPPNCDLVAARFGEHPAQGIAVGEPAPFMPVGELDAIVPVSATEIASAQEWLLRRHRLLVGPSSAANLAAMPAAREHPACVVGKRLFVTLLFDRGEDYL